MPKISSFYYRRNIAFQSEDLTPATLKRSHSRIFKRSIRTFLLGLAIFGAVQCGTVQAQPKGTRTSAPAQQRNVLPMLLGGIVSGMLLGGAIATLLKKPVVVEKEEVPDPIFGESPTPFAYVDTKEYITQCNEAFSKYLGIEDANGQPLPNFLHPDDLAPTRIQLHLIYDGDNLQTALPTRLFRPDGTMLHAKITMRNADGKRKPSSVLVAFEDQTARVSAETELTGAREAVRALYEVMSAEKSSSLDDKMKSLLAMGCGRFDLPIGVLASFNRDEEQGDTFETLFVQSPDKRIRPAMVLPRVPSHAIEAKLLGLSKLPNGANWGDHPYIAANDEVAYLGAPVLVSNKLFGMLSFAAIERRPNGFAPGETELLQLMAEWVGGEIERENARITLENQQNELISANQKLEALATHDALTEAKNRRAFNDKLAEEWSRATRYGTPLSLVLLDVDKFKTFNDEFGHQAGDVVLKRVAALAMSAVRTTDFFARYGGEEFALILPNTEIEGAMILAERLRIKVEGGQWRERQVTASFGVASITPAMRSGEELTEMADKALYASKERGRNRVTHASELRETPDPSARI